MKRRWIPHYWRGRHHFPDHEPFEWIVEDLLGVSCWPDDDHFTDEFPENKIKVIINLCEFDYPEGVPDGYTYYHIPVPDYGVPTEDQIHRFLEITDLHQKKEEPVVVHCVAGCGRTGQMVAIWAAYNGWMDTHSDPIKWIRERRKCSCETCEQEKLVKTWVERFRNHHHDKKSPQ